jgi:DNA-directed RNA polymerase subunit RPC12/RpoP
MGKYSIAFRCLAPVHKKEHKDKSFLQCPHCNSNWMFWNKYLRIFNQPIKNDEIEIGWFTKINEI